MKLLASFVVGLLQVVGSWFGITHTHRPVTPDRTTAQSIRATTTAAYSYPSSVRQSTNAKQRNVNGAMLRSSTTSPSIAITSIVNRTITVRYTNIESPPPAYLFAQDEWMSAPEIRVKLGTGSPLSGTVQFTVPANASDGPYDVGIGPGQMAENGAIEPEIIFSGPLPTQVHARFTISHGVISIPGLPLSGTSTSSATSVAGSGASASSSPGEAQKPNGENCGTLTAGSNSNLQDTMNAIAQTSAAQCLGNHIFNGCASAYLLTPTSATSSVDDRYQVGQVNGVCSLGVTLQSESPGTGVVVACPLSVFNEALFQSKTAPSALVQSPGTYVGALLFESGFMFIGLDVSSKISSHPSVPGCTVTSF